MEISGETLDLVLYGTCPNTTVNFHNVWTARQLFMPEGVCILPSTVPGARCGVFCTRTIKKGTEIGPYPGQLVAVIDGRTATRAWEIYSTNGAFLGYMDGGQCTGNWITHVQCARTEREQNLVLVQIGGKIFYRATQDITRGQELLVWYGNTYTLYMGIPSYGTETVTNIEKHIITSKQEIQTKNKSQNLNIGKWNCVLCHRHFNSRSNLRSHMRIHTLEKPFSCKFCGRRFSQSSTLRNHIRLHTGEKPYRCFRCNSSYSQLAGLRAHQRSATHKPSLEPSA